jgi:hypothetical protein
MPPEENTQQTDPNAGNTGQPPQEGGQPSDDQFRAAVEAEVAGLKRSNEELKAEKVEAFKARDEMRAIYEKLGGEDGVTSLLKMRENLQNDELGRLLSDGKHEEWYDRRVAAMRQDHENQISSLNEALVKEQKQRELSEGKLRSTILNAEVLRAASALGVVPEAGPDVMLRAERDFTYDPERDQLVIRDENGGVVFGKDGANPKGIAEWLEEQKPTARHWWPASKGGGAGGSGEPASESSEMPKDFKAYRAARRKQQGLD